MLLKYVIPILLMSDEYNEDKRELTDRDFRGRYLLVFFGFTHCPDICPTELQVMAAALEALSPQERKEIVPVFITLDPERDTPEVMATYVKNFGQDFVGLTGSAECNLRRGQGLPNRLLKIPTR